MHGCGALTVCSLSVVVVVDSLTVIEGCRRRGSFLNLWERGPRHPAFPRLLPPCSAHAPDRCPLRPPRPQSGTAAVTWWVAWPRAPPHSPRHPSRPLTRPGGHSPGPRGGGAGGGVHVERGGEAAAGGVGALGKGLGSQGLYPRFQAEMPAEQGPVSVPPGPPWVGRSHPGNPWDLHGACPGLKPPYLRGNRGRPSQRAA